MRTFLPLLALLLAGCGTPLTEKDPPKTVVPTPLDAGRVSSATRNVSESAHRASEGARGTTNAVDDAKAVADAVERTVVKIVEVSSPQVQSLVEELKAGIALLQEKLAAAQAKAKLTEEANADLMGNIRTLDIEVSDLRERAGARQQALEQLTSNNQALRDNNKALNKSVEELREEVAAKEALRKLWKRTAVVSLTLLALVLVAVGISVYKKIAAPWLP